MTSDSTCVVACLITLDTKAREAEYFKQCVVEAGHTPLIIDIGVVGSAGFAADISREDVAAAGGRTLESLLETPTREEAGPVMVAGSIALVQKLIAEDKLHAIVGVGGTQGTTLCCEVMRSLPYGFPKIMVSTVASGDTQPFVGIKDITMMFSVGDLLGLNRVTRMVLGNAAGAAVGMASHTQRVRRMASKPVVAMTNLGVLTEGATYAQQLFEEAGYEVIVFHAVGSGGRAMEQMMKEGLIAGVFDYAMGEISDDVFGVLRAGGPERMSVAGKMGLPQVIVPGGAEHLGILVDPPNHVPEEFENHTYVFHSPVVFVPRLKGDELERVAESVGERLKDTTSPLALFIPRAGTSRYSIPGGELHDPESDAAFFAALQRHVPTHTEVSELPQGAEDPVFVEAAVKKLLSMMQ